MIGNPGPAPIPDPRIQHNPAFGPAGGDLRPAPVPLVEGGAGVGRGVARLVGGRPREGVVNAARPRAAVIHVEALAAGAQGQIFNFRIGLIALDFGDTMWFDLNPDPTK